MSFPYPQDRHRDRKEKGEQPYKDAKEAMAQQEAAESIEGQEHGQEAPRLSSLSRGGDDIPSEVLDRLGAASDEVEASRGDADQHRNRSPRRTEARGE